MSSADTSADTSADQQTDSTEWSDPLVGLQVEQFRGYVQKCVDSTLDASEVLKVSEYLCEWSRNLLNRTFGRTTQAEIDEITGMFRDTADSVKRWAEIVGDPAQKETVQVYAAHIRQRTGCQEAGKAE